MKITLAYGKTGLPIEIPDEWSAVVVEPVYVPGLPDPAGAIRQALRRPIGCAPLTEAVRRLPSGARVGVIFSDITRPTPNHILLPAVLAELAEAGVLPEQITLFNALGTHRPNTDAELRRMLGDEVVDGYRIVQNDAFDYATQVCLGVSSRGHEMWINRELAACDLKILTGFIEPHFFAGFSGGGKAVMPGMAGLKTVLGNHDAGMIGHPKATWGVTHGNPIWEEVREVARALAGAGVFLLNVALNKDKQITGVFAGDLDAAHAQGCDFVRQTAMQPVPRPFDIVVTTNSGYPLDLNLYQAVKGMSAAAQIVKPGGVDRRRRRVLGRHPRPWVVRATAARGQKSAGTARPHQYSGFPGPGPVGGAGAGADPAQGGRVPAHSRPDRATDHRLPAQAVPEY